MLACWPFAGDLAPAVQARGVRDRAGARYDALVAEARDALGERDLPRIQKSRAGKGASVQEKRHQHTERCRNFPNPLKYTKNIRVSFSTLEDY